MAKTGQKVREKRASQDKNQDVVYFLRCPLNGLVKIGWTTRTPRERLASTATLSPVVLELVATLPGDQFVERQLHRRFAEFRSHGEWFRDNQELSELMADSDSWDQKPLHAPRVVPEAEDRETIDEWATRTELTIRGVTRFVWEWCDLTGVSAKAIHMRLRATRDVDSVLGLGVIPTWNSGWNPDTEAHKSWQRKIRKWRSALTPGEFSIFMNRGIEPVHIRRKEEDMMLEEDAW